MLSDNNRKLSFLAAKAQGAQVLFATKRLISINEMDFTEAQRNEARTFGEFYIDMMENYRNTVKYYLSQDVILDWFGQTVKGEKTVSLFLKKNLSSVKHFMSVAVPVKKIGFRDTHIVNIPKEPKKIPIGLMSPPRITITRSQTKTPKKQTDPSTSSSNSKDRERDKERGQGDGLHNLPDLPLSPAKRFKPSGGDFSDIDLETVEGESDGPPKVKYVMAEGAVEFHRPSIKKLQTETKWKRPCKLSIAYSSTNCNDCTIYLIIYEGNVKCRRNLMKEFEAEEPEN
ncbi:hypothetical protein NQ318_013579 [Aromia moschata]|uniref:Uncharacterized protein n=1 Tax=Aromia moschata TaxID=1265417 RepID=A0AAV8YDI3_9CUCU|nr:hypothetical protein NQ318_013579 [Aromia moschata]